MSNKDVTLEEILGDEVERKRSKARTPKAEESQVEAEMPKADLLTEGNVEQQVVRLGRLTAAKLHKERKERVIVAEDPINPKDQYVWAGINGYNFRIKRGEPVELPEPVVDLLEQGGYVVRRAR